MSLRRTEVHFYEIFDRFGITFLCVKNFLVTFYCVKNSKKNAKKVGKFPSVVRRPPLHFFLSQNPIFYDQQFEKKLGPPNVNAIS